MDWSSFLLGVASATPVAGGACWMVGHYGGKAVGKVEATAQHAKELALHAVTGSISDAAKKVADAADNLVKK